MTGKIYQSYLDRKELDHILFMEKVGRALYINGELDTEEGLQKFTDAYDRAVKASVKFKANRRWWHWYKFPPFEWFVYLYFSNKEKKNESV